MEKYHGFLLSDLNWTFINTKRNTYLNLPYPRTLYMYSSLCAPEHMGDQTTDLIHQIHYQPILEGNYYYEPKQIHYIKLRTNHIDVAETQISESALLSSHFILDMYVNSWMPPPRKRTKEENVHFIHLLANLLHIKSGKTTLKRNYKICFAG